ncbi:MAG: hypothetical protein JXR64_02585 [Spirochaetales bacterium]|nr:hypothetical protein [Spirochaetales bacterium]
MKGMDCIVTIQDEELIMDFSVSLGKENIVMPISDKKSDLNPLDILTEEELLTMRDLALEEAKTLYNG